MQQLYNGTWIFPLLFQPQVSLSNSNFEEKTYIQRLVTHSDKPSN